jgi:hypothetical protein
MSEDELRDLRERVQLVDQLAENPGWPMLWDRALVTIAAKQTRVVQGKCVDHEDYVRECGFLEGVEFVRKLPERLRLELEMQVDSLPPEEGVDSGQEDEEEGF